MIFTFLLTLLCCFVTAAISSGNDAYLLYGKATCVRSNVDYVRADSILSFVVAVTENECLTGCNLGEEKEKFFFASSKNPYGITIETKVRKGDLLKQESERRLIVLVEQKRAPLTDDWNSRLSAAEMGSFSHFVFPLFLASQNHGVERSVFLHFLDSGANPFHKRLECGDLSIFGVGGIDKIVITQTEKDQYVVSVPRTLAQTSYGPFRNGIKRSERTATFNPPFALSGSSPWECDCDTLIEGLDGQSINVAHKVRVDYFQAGKTRAKAFIDSIVTSVPEGSEIVSDEKMKSVWSKGVRTKAVDFLALRMAENSTFGNSRSAIWFLSLGLLVFVGLGFIVMRYRR